MEGEIKNLESESSNQCLEATFSTRAGINLSAKIWGDEVGPQIRVPISLPFVPAFCSPLKGYLTRFQILALHGWSDNAGSFDLLAPLIVKASPLPIQVVCLDFAGHGRSDHRRGGVYEEEGHVHDAVDVVGKLRWQKFIVMGHSMGGAMGMYLAVALPDRVEKLIMLDTLGPWSRGADETVAKLREHFREYTENTTPKRREFRSRKEGADRLLSVNPFLSQRSAEILMKRGMIPVGDGYLFSYDIKVRNTNARRFAEEQLLAMISAIECPVMIVVAEGKKPNWEAPVKVLEKRIPYYKRLQLVTLDGGHHVHLDEPELTFSHLRPFIYSETPSAKL